MRQKTPILYAIFIILITMPAIMSAQEQIGFRQLSIKDGLSQNSAISIAQDSTGFLWIATQDGLNKYDGRSFTKYPFIFSDVTRPTYSQLGKVYVDRKGAVWCIPASGNPQKLNPQTKSFESLEAIEDASVMYQDTNGNYWIGTYGRGLIVLDSTGRILPEVSPIAHGSHCYDLEQDGNTMLAATDLGVLELSLSSKVVLDTIQQSTMERNGSGIFSTLLTDRSGRQWFGTFGGGLYYRDPTDRIMHPAATLPLSQPLPPDLNILSLWPDSNNNLWVGTYGSGLYKVDLQKFEVRHFIPDKHNPKAIHYNDILCIYEDYTGTLWFGTDGAGASYYDAFLEKFNSITNFQVPDDIHVDVVRAIEADCRESVWIGTSGKGLMQYQTETAEWKNYTVQSAGLLSDRIMSLFCEGDGDLLVGTQGGGLTLISADGIIRNYLEEMPYDSNAMTIWDIFRDSRERTWLATREQGLILFDKEKGMHRAYNPESGYPGMAHNIRVITEGAGGELWLGTDSDGLIRFDPDRKQLTSFRHTEDATSLPNDRIKSLYFQPSGTLWVGTYGSGLSEMHMGDGTFRTYDETDGLANNVIYAILPDEQNILWLSSNRGITRFGPPDSPDSEPEIVNYTNYEGLATEFNTGAYYKSEDGTLYYGGLEGFYWFDPKAIRNNTQQPKTVITELQVANEARPLSDKLKLNYRENTLTFTFASLQYALPEKNQYKYQLLNYDEDWVHAGNINFARYSFLPPGDYEFHVLSSNYDGVWNENPVRFSFSIAPPWYASQWARVLYILLLTLGIAGAYFYLRWRWQMKVDLKLKEEETNRLQRLNDFKTKLYTDIAHEFRTPLSLIAAPVENKLTNGGLTDSEFAEYSMINRNTHRLIDLVDQLLEMARLEKGKWPIRLKEANASLFIRALLPTFEHQAILKKILYTWTVDDTGDVWFASDALEKILVNLLANAIKYTPEGGSCTFAAIYSNEHIVIDIRNTVEDPRTIEVENLFERFYQGADYTSGAGIGLSLVKEMVALYHGEIEARMEGDTIVFALSLPTNPGAIPGAKKMVNEHPAPHYAMHLPVDRIEKSAASKEQKGNNLPLVLLVEDHQEIRDYLKKAWENKYDILEATNGAEGITKALEAVPDLILTDIRMPVCNGIELCNTLKQDERSSHIPIILLTSGDEVETELKGLESGADDFISKPFKLPVLEKRVDNLIRLRRSLRKRYSQEITLEAKDLAITPADEAFLNRVQDVLDQQLSDPGFNATSFCDLLGMSRMQLHRKLQLYTGLSTTAFIRSQRLKQAANLIKSSGLSINEVAYSVGFNTPSYFIKCFREAYNTTPAAYSGGAS